MRRWLDQLLRRLQPFRTDADISEELHAHYDALVEAGRAAGLSVREANRSARLQLGGSRSVVERVREGEFSSVIGSVYRDFVMGLRSIRRNPVFAITAILTLAAGIGANTLVFTLLHGLLLRSLPVEDPAALVRIGVASPAIDAFSQSDMPYRMLQQLRQRQNSFIDVFGWQNRFVVLESGEGVQAGLVERDGFATLGLKPHIGRLITAADDVPGGPAEGWPVVLGHGYWMDTFGGDPGVLGKRISLSKTTATIVGVAPKGFRGLWHGSETKLFLPLHFVNVLMGKNVLDGPNGTAWTVTIARFRHDLSIESARAELKILESELIRQFIPAEMQARPEFNNAFLSVASARTGLPTFFGRVYSRPLFLMQGLVAIVLLLCCVNVAGLMMAKVHARRQEFAVRTAIGAARWRLVRQYLTESFVIALAGAGLGAIAAWYGTAYMLPFFRHPNEGVGMSISPDATVFQITACFAVLTTLLFGTLPAWRAGAAGYAPLLRS
ncbi:MAG: FtsX-like permease family protein, partial [Acidobacteria bacterium]|nr:FtsX-like permease family protein [Acidobacteriota bacterium]